MVGAAEAPVTTTGAGAAVAMAVTAAGSDTTDLPGSKGPADYLIYYASRGFACAASSLLR